MKFVTTRFNDKHFRETWSKQLVKLQTEKLEAYAQKELEEMVKSHDFKNRTYNLQDSFCWILFFNGKERSHGFYGSGRSSENTILHERSSERVELPTGRLMAEDFVVHYTPVTTKGWEIVWASTVPYGVFLEDGTTPMKHSYYVITQRYDAIKSELSPMCKVTVERKYI